MTRAARSHAYGGASPGGSPPRRGGRDAAVRTLATARRVLTQLHGDKRTIALLLFVPCLLMSLLHWVFADQPGTFDRVGLQMLGIFPFVTMFLVTSVAMLRERTSGTLERLLSTPLGKLDLLGGYAIAFGVAALVQATLASALSLGVLGLDAGGPAAIVVLLAVADALLGMALGLLVSAFARTEFQAVQFLPAFVLPQVLLCGLIAPRSEMSGALEAISGALPMTYAVDAMTQLTAGTDLLVVMLSSAAALALGAATLRRRTA
jgi:ABC-2 type transport system permease protein